jgi:3',5'-cyclic-AMP phosphodiesterase
MKFINRRDFLKYSLYTFALLSTQLRLPVVAAKKAFSPFKFAFVPDLHLSSYRFNDWILLNESLLLLQDTVKTINNLDVDFVVFGGDLIENKQQDYSDMPVLLDVIYELNKPYYVIPGEREADLKPDYDLEHFTAEFRRNGFHTPGYTYWSLNPIEGVELIGLDSTIRNQMNGRVSQEQIDWLQNCLSTRHNNFRILCVHHPLTSGSTAKGFYNSDEFRLTNSDEVRQTIDRFQNVDLALSGHRHLNHVSSSNNTHYINSPSIVTYPCEFRVIKVTPGFIQVENVSISYKQIIKKARQQLIESKYARQFPNIKPKELISLHYGTKDSRNSVIKI